MYGYQTLESKIRVNLKNKIDLRGYDFQTLNKFQTYIFSVVKFLEEV